MADVTVLGWAVLPTPPSRQRRFSEMPSSWRLHAVVSEHRTACGIRRQQWACDLFIDRKCLRCLRALGLACPECKGTGMPPGKGFCIPCKGTGEKQP